LPKERKKPKWIRILGILIIFYLVSTAITWIPVTETICLDLFPGEGAPVKILLLTDLHSCYYGKDQEKLHAMIEKAAPDLVLIGGDYFDDEIPEDNAKITAQYLAANYPTYYVAGNHEFWSGHADAMKDELRDLGITVLEGDCESITINGHEIDLCGVDDPDGTTSETEWRAQLDRAQEQTDKDHLRILLSHRPERVSVYEQYDFDLILTGHAHAGQILIPLANRGLYAPDQGPFAKYVNGTYTLSNGSTMIVGRGLARESFPLPRYFNHPELVLIEID